MNVGAVGAILAVRLEIATGKLFGQNLSVAGEAEATRLGRWKGDCGVFEIFKIYVVFGIGYDVDWGGEVHRECEMCCG